MMDALLNNSSTLTTLMRAAWRLIYTGQGIVALSEAFEGPEPYSVRCNLAWTLRAIGEDLERLGERLEKYVNDRAAKADINSDDYLGPLMA
ncbi:hypothetical protein UB31_00500 [Bradyrhizobium sp. LTSP849]|uniref:hypothetical protein n=1 Tax=Bradyrhizobium sp. LTSP849 TaxID=1615890 RepID=UPI0005D17B38|nr:hypothetical protein [Bradyrhizobium sp. LTSP849]KJC55493.1 hypothetical protein UB31_00500 [Bradyrhizobium sp. LTSP849]